MPEVTKPILAPLTEDEVKSLVNYWYFLLDVHAPVDQVLPLLADDGLEMQFPEATLRGKKEFIPWYEGVIRIFFDEVHVMQRLQITRSADGAGADVELVVKWLAKRWRPPAARSEWLGFDASQRWVVVRSPQTQNPIILTYIVDALAPMEGSVAL
jgi:hypothetical protein